METSPSYIISSVSFNLGRFKPIFNDCLILRAAICQIHESLQYSYFSDYISAVDFIRSALRETDCPFRFFLDSVRVDATSSDGVEYIFLKVFVNVS